MYHRLLKSRIPLLVICLSIAASVAVKQQAVASCDDISLIFARGSSQSDIPVTDQNFKVDNRETREAAVFFEQIESRIAPWISKEKINLPGNGANAATSGFNTTFRQYNTNGYKAVGAFDFTNAISEVRLPHAVEAKFGIDGSYATSVEDGADTLADFLADRVTACPHQQIVLGGYSQGSQVVGEALGKMSASTRAHINFVALFGDPKLNLGSRGGRLVGTDAAPWARGNVRWWQSSGGLGARDPYIPDDMVGRVGSWCDQEDLVCTGDVPSTAIETAFASGHEKYPDLWMGQAANEIATHLLASMPAYTGAIGAVQWIPQYGQGKVTDAMIVIDTTGSMGTIIDQAKQNATNIVNSIFNNFHDARVGLVQFRDHDTASPFVVQSVVPLSSNRQEVINAISGLSTGDGGDDSEAWYSGIMTAYNQDWRNGAKKLMFLIADTAPHDPEPVTQYTAAKVIQKSREIDPVQIYPIWFNGFIGSTFQADFQQSAGQLASLTGGRIIQTPNSLNGNIPQGFLDSITRISNDPVAYIDGPSQAESGEELVISGMASYDPDSTIVNYAWDFDNDQQIDYQSASPITTWTYSVPYRGLVTLVITSADGGTSSATLAVNIGNAPEPLPGQGGGVENIAQPVVSLPETAAKDPPAKVLAANTVDAPKNPAASQPTIKNLASVNQKFPGLFMPVAGGSGRYGMFLKSLATAAAVIATAFAFKGIALLRFRLWSNKN